MESLEVLGERRTILSNKGRTQAPRGFTWVKSKEPVKTLKSQRYNQTNPLKNANNFTKASQSSLKT